MNGKKQSLPQNKRTTTARIEISFTIDSVYKGRISNKVCKIAKHFTEVNAIIVFLRQFANNNFEYMQQSQQEATHQHQQRLENLLVAPV